MVTRVNWSPAREPKGLDPPVPPSAPMRPPPLPRWIRTSRIRNRPISRIRRLSRSENTPHEKVSRRSDPAPEQIAIIKGWGVFGKTDFRPHPAPKTLSAPAHGTRRRPFLAGALLPGRQPLHGVDDDVA